MIKKFIDQIRSGFIKLKDPRNGKNSSYDFVDVAIAGYSIFHMQSPSILAHQERLTKLHGEHNGHTLFGFKKIPSDNQIRNLLDSVETKDIEPIFDDIHSNIDTRDFMCEGGLVVAIDGVHFFSSEKVSCSCCLIKQSGKVTKYQHAMLVPALIHPEQKCALPMAPEFISNQDGFEKQDCEVNSAKRWCNAKNNWLTNNKVTLLGDDLFSRKPLIEQLVSYKNVRFIFVAKPTSHKYMFEWIDGYESDDIETCFVTEKQGAKKHIFQYRIYNKIPLTGDVNSPEVNYFEMTVTDGKGKKIYYNTFVTNHLINKSNIHNIARMGRNRWRIENEAFNILKTKGYNLEHNFGHGKKNLSNILACFNLLAFLVHYLSEITSDLYREVRNCFGARIRFFQALAFTFTLQIWDSWDTLLKFTLEISRPRLRGRRSN